VPGTIIRRLESELHGEVRFGTLEQQLASCLVGDGRGHIEVRASSRISPGSETDPSSRLELDQTSLPSILRQLDAVIGAFPVIG
jgi:hypothetical protein